MACHFSYIVQLDDTSQGELLKESRADLSGNWVSISTERKSNRPSILLWVIPELSVGTFIIVYPLLEYMSTCSCGHHVLDSLS